MKKIPGRFRWSHLLLVVSMVACDQIGIDLAPAVELETTTENQFVALVDQPLAIDIKKIPNLSGATTFHIEKKPELGEARFTDKGLLLYIPQPDFVAGDDELVITSDANTVTGTGTTIPLRISMLTVDDKLPCRVGAVSDSASTSLNKSVAIPILRNDLFCEGTADPSSIQIVSLPKNGTVKITGENVTYTPKEGYLGRDTFIYQVCNKGAADKSCFVAAVSVGVTNPSTVCQIDLLDNVVAFKPIFVYDSVRIPVLANDVLCKSARTIPITIPLPPVYGTAYIASGNVVVYKAKMVALSDEFWYRRCDMGNCIDAVVQIRGRIPIPNCTAKAINDSRTLSLKATTDEIKQNGLIIPVLANDNLCDILKAVVIKDNPSNASIEVLRDGRILYKFDNRSKPSQFTFTYEVTDVKENKTSAEVKIILNE